MSTLLLSSLLLVNGSIMPSDQLNPPQPYGAIPSERQRHERDVYCLMRYISAIFESKQQWELLIKKASFQILKQNLFCNKLC